MDSARVTSSVLVGALLWLAPAAHGAVRAAESILPPGQSGFVPLTGIASGKGAAHSVDQLAPFQAFRWKSMAFDQAARRTERPRPSVAIARDRFGVPNVRAGSMEDAWWGAGYAIAQDRLFQIDAARRAATGRLAEVLGRDSLEDDMIARRDGYTRRELEAMLAALPPAMRARAAAYRAGVNAWVARVRSDPMLLPAEFVGTGVSPQPLTPADQAAIGVLLARSVPSADGEELRNLRALRAIGRRNFDALLPLRQPREVLTIPPSEGVFPSQPGRTRRQERRALTRSLRASAGWELPAPASVARARTRAPLGGSSMFAARARDGRTVLFSGPQLGFTAPELFVELEVHYPGTDLRGVTAPGVPAIGIGTNGDLAWGLTSGLSDEDDLYAERLVGAERYRFRGAERRMECRTERFAYGARLNALLDGRAPESGHVDKRICRTVHGPVQLRAGGTAYARRYAIWGRELETVTGLAALNDAHTVREADRALRLVTWNENVLAIDSRGGLGFWHPGLQQLRPRGYDERLPYPGTGEAEWRGLRDRARTPRVIDPRRRWLVNWNNVPARGSTTGDAPSIGRLAGPFHRAGYLERLVAAWARSPTLAGAQDVIRAAGTTAQQRPLASARARRAARGAGGPARAVLDALLRWDGSYDRSDARGTVDPGVALWEELKERLSARAVARLGGAAAQPLAGERPGSSHVFDATNGEAYALRHAGPHELRAAAAEAHAALARRFGSGEVARWREPRRRYEWIEQGLLRPPPLRFFDRGTYEQFVELGSASR